MTTAIRKQIESLQARINRMPKVARWRGRRVVPVDKWELEDWSTFPDSYHIGFSLWLKPPKDWWNDYLTLLTKTQDPAFGQALCHSCAIYLAQQVRETIEHFSWTDRGGDEAREKFYITCEPYLAAKFRLHDAMEQTHLHLYNEAAGANDRTCNVKNYFKCPYGKEREELREDGHEAKQLWQIVEWYHAHWDPDYSIIPAESERKWYHRNEPRILDVASLDDVLKAADDGRIQKIAEEKEQYRKENPS